MPAAHTQQKSPPPPPGAFLARSLSITLAYVVYLPLCFQKTVWLLEQIVSADKIMSVQSNFFFACGIEFIHVHVLFMWIMHVRTTSPGLLGAVIVQHLYEGVL